MRMVSFRSSVKGQRKSALRFAQGSGMLRVGNGDSSLKRGEDFEKVDSLCCVTVTPSIGTGVDIALSSSYISDCMQFIKRFD